MVYILYSSSLNRFYVGVTADIHKRLDKHLSHFYGDNSFTAKTTDWILKQVLECNNEQQAKAVEKHIKLMKSSKYIENLIAFEPMRIKLLERFASDS